MSGESEKKPSLSFGFAKKTVSKLTDSAIRDDSTKEANDETDFVLEVNRSEIKGTKKKEVKAELIIPCHGNTYKLLPPKKAAPENIAVSKPEEPEKELTEEELAAKALIEESQNWREQKENEEKPNENLVIPLQSTDEDLLDDKALFEADLASRPEVSSRDDYETIPVEGFGMAMLKGMGFKADEGIGGFRKAKIDCIEPVVRPKGLGLGASIPKPKSGDSKSKDSKMKNGEEELVLKKGAFVHVQSGSHKGQYGEVDGFDDESARVFVRIHGKAVSVSENAVFLVTKAEFEKYKNVINKDMFDQYSEKQKNREKEWSDNRMKRNHEESTIPKDAAVENNGGKHYYEEKSSSKKAKKSNVTWVRPRLRVRIVDKRSKYYKQKVVVNDVISPERIECMTESGRILDDIDPYDVETVIPKDDMALVMIVRGPNEHRGKVAEILKRDTKRELAAIRILPDKEEVLKLYYDDICEVTGDISEYL